MSVNLTQQKRTKDRRIEKTHASLREALASLVREKDYDEISVTEILKRANVGRSTFYMHFAGKDELLLGSMQGMLRSVPAIPASAPEDRHENIVRFSLPILAHVVEQRAHGTAMRPGGRAVLHEHLQSALTGIIAEEVRRELKGRRKTAGQPSPELLAKFIASTFVLVVNWWLESEIQMLPKEVDVIFRALVLPTLAKMSVRTAVIENSSSSDPPATARFR